MIYMTIKIVEGYIGADILKRKSIANKGNCYGNFYQNHPRGPYDRD